METEKFNQSELLDMIIEIQSLLEEKKRLVKQIKVFENNTIAIDNFRLSYVTN